MQIDISRFRAAFYVEAAEHLEAMEAALLQLESMPGDRELLNSVFRAAHSIKGGSTTFGVNEVGRFTHVLENLLERLREGTTTTTTELIELLLDSVDIIQQLLAADKDGADPPTRVDEVYRALQQVNDRLAGGDSTHAAPAEATPNSIAGENSDSAKQGRYTVTFRPSRDFFRFGQEPLLLLRELHELGRVLANTIDDQQLPPLAELQFEDCYLNWRLEIETSASEQALHDVFMFLDSSSTYTINRQQEQVSEQLEAEPIVEERRSGTDRRGKSVAANRTNDSETVRVDRQRLDELINQIGELVIGASMVEQDLLSIAGGHSLESMSALGKIVRDLQEMSLALRMVPIAATFQKLNRVARDVAKKVDRQIIFVTEGDDTELDKSVVDQISDPLIHMVRNAVDHGIEPADVRIAAGKDVAGTITLRAYQQGGNIYIEMSDDGKGLDRKRILQKGIERGLVAPDATLTDAEICNLIFQPGFSTAAQVTDVSGRGVGMDVVRRNVEALQGSVTIRSVEGQGSTVTVRLPLTLAILDGLLVRLTQEVFVIPLLSVIESICIRAEEIRSIVEVGEVITLRGQVVPLFRLHSLLNIPRSTADDSSGLMVIVEDQGRRMALMVDELLGQQQVVIKNLETNFVKVPGVAGATILGDGRVALILDIFGVSNLIPSGATL